MHYEKFARKTDFDAYPDDRSIRDCIISCDGRQPSGGSDDLRMDELQDGYDGVLL